LRVQKPASYDKEGFFPFSPQIAAKKFQEICGSSGHQSLRRSFALGPVHDESFTGGLPKNSWPRLLTSTT
jgi:hypothetical protein